jgi:hypothetical protein
MTYMQTAALCSENKWTAHIKCTDEMSVCNGKAVCNNDDDNNSVTLARERSIPTERPPLVGEASAHFCG